MVRGSISNDNYRAILLDSGSSRHCIGIRVQARLFVQHDVWGERRGCWAVSGIDCDGQFPDSVSGHGTALECIYNSYVLIKLTRGANFEDQWVRRGSSCCGTCRAVWLDLRSPWQRARIYLHDVCFDQFGARGQAAEIRGWSSMSTSIQH